MRPHPHHHVGHHTYYPTYTPPVLRLVTNAMVLLLPAERNIAGMHKHTMHTHKMVVTVGWLTRAQRMLRRLRRATASPALPFHTRVVTAAVAVAAESVGAAG